MKISRFDGDACWATLTPEQQAEIGAAALEYAAGSFATGQVSGEIRQTPLERAAEASWDQATDNLLRVVAAILPEDAWFDGEDQVLIPSCLGPVCRECGCSHNDACAGGCAWAEADLCTACVKGVA